MTLEMASQEQVALSLLQPGKGDHLILGSPIVVTAQALMTAVEQASGIVTALADSQNNHGNLLSWKQTNSHGLAPRREQ